MDAQKKDWDELDEAQRNCLMWPDFLCWSEPSDKVIRRQANNPSLGLVSTVVQDPVKMQCYNIIKRIKDGGPAHGVVNPYEWIIAIDGQSTLQENNGIGNLIKNQKNQVCLSLRKAVHPLNNAKNWGEVKIVYLYLKEKKVGFELVHFYSKEENGDIKDRILFWDVKPTKELYSTSELLHRGDELLEVDGVPVLPVARVGVERKKLAEIYKLIFRQIPREVELKIKPIEHVRRTYQETATCPIEVTAKATNAPDSSTRPENGDAQNSDDARQLIVVEKETEVYQNSSIPEDSLSETSELLAEVKISAEARDTTAGLEKPLQETKTRHSGRKRLSRSGSGGKIQRQLSSTSENEGYVDSGAENTPGSRRRSLSNTNQSDSTNDKMCRSCKHNTNRNTRLPDDRNAWPIDKIEEDCLEQMCKLLDQDGINRKPLLSALGCFTVNDAALIVQEFRVTGGRGLAKNALRIWGSREHSHNVGLLKKIVNDDLMRVDVITVIEKWEQLSVCHGCGVKLKHQ